MFVRRMLRCHWRWLVPATVLVLVTWFPLYDLWHVNALRSRACQLSVGDSAARVIQLLGEPTLILPKSNHGWIRETETWGYGGVFDWPNAVGKEWPFFCPFRLRLFGHDPDDVVIEFDDAGTVIGIQNAQRR